MQIKEIHLYGYGKWTNQSFLNLHDLQVFYGENEAGKSTIMSFIHSILFGFPTKQQAELRYEPKMQEKYGGKLVVFIPEMGVVSIERVKGKASGNVTVLFEDGTIGNEETLSSILGGMDKAFFQSIYSFNIHGIQNIYRLKNEDIGRYLFSAGAIGSDRLLKTEVELQKELDNRFKPAGRNPVLNQRLSKIKETKERLNKAQKEQEQYSYFLMEKAKMEQEINQLQQELQMINNKKNKLKEIERLLPFIHEEKAVLEKWHSIPDHPFPVDGLERLERIDKEIIPIEARISALSENVEKWSNELSVLNPDRQWIKKEAEIISLSERLPLYEKILLEEQSLLQKIEEYQNQMIVIKEQLHWSDAAFNPASINTSIFLKKKIAQSSSNYSKLVEKRNLLDEQFQQEKAILEKVEEQVQLVSNNIKSDAEMSAIHSEIAEFTISDQAKNEYEWVNNQLKSLSKQVKVEQVSIKRHNIQNKLTGTILFGISIWCVFENQWFFFSITFALSLFLLLGFRRSKESHLATQIRQLKERECHLAVRINEQDKEKINGFKEEIYQQEKNLQMLTQLNMRLEEQNKRYELVIQAFEKWEHDMQVQENNLNELLNELHLPKDIEWTQLMVSFELIEEWKQYHRKTEQLEKKIEINRLEQNQFYSQFLQLKDMLQIAESKPSEAIFMMKNRMRKEQETHASYLEKSQKIQQTLDELDQLYSERGIWLNERDQLLSLAHIGTVEEFRQIGKQVMYKAELEKEMLQLTKQIGHFKWNEQDKLDFYNLGAIDIEYQSLVQQEEGKIQEINYLHEQLSECKYVIQQIEEGGTYSEILHKFKQEQSIFDQEAKEWATFALAKHFLFKAIDQYKHERLPKILTYAEGLLQQLTNGKYIRIYFDYSANTFMIERNDRITFYANELSQATAEQVYIAIRFALAVILYDSLKLPFIIDDSFVNFDHIRTEQMVKVLKLINQKHQIILFTCHRHLLEYFQENSILNLNDVKTISSSVR